MKLDKLDYTEFDNQECVNKSWRRLKILPKLINGLNIYSLEENSIITE